MRLDRRVVIAFVVEPVFANVICCGKTGLDFAKLVGDRLVNVADAGLVVDLYFGVCKRLLDTHDRRQNLILYVNELDGFVEDIGVERGNCGHGVAYVAYFVDSQGVLVLTGGKNAIFLREVCAGNDGKNAWQSQCSAGIDGEYTGMWIRRTQQPPIEHAWKHNIVGVECAASYFGIGVDFWPGRTDDLICSFLLTNFSHDIPPLQGEPPVPRRRTCAGQRLQRLHRFLCNRYNGRGSLRGSLSFARAWVGDARAKGQRQQAAYPACSSRTA